jgi:AAA+ superfamily predicted ATPase
MSKNKNNNKNIDISGNKNKNHFIPPLQLSNIKKSWLFKNNLLDISDNIQLDIKNNNLMFNMRFDSILDELRKNRRENEEKIKDNSFDKIRDSLDKTADFNDEIRNKTKNNLELVPFNKKLYKNTFNKILNDIDERYNIFFNNDLSKNLIKSTIKKKDTGTQYGITPPPTFPNNIFGDKNIVNPFFDSNNAWGNNAWSNSNWGGNKSKWPIKPLVNHQNTPSIGFSQENFNFNKQNPPVDGMRIPPPIHIKKKKVKIEREINGLVDILKLIDDYPMKIDIEYNINMQAMHNIKKPLEDLDNMIGMNKLKDAIVDQIIFFSQNLHMGNDFMHTVIYGPPGTGKTEIAKIMGRIFSSIGILENNKFRKATRADLIAGYLGQTAIKTRDVIKDCLGGVLFIDEAYALGNREKRDSFAKECIDTLCEGLSDNKDKLMVIIAGYEEDLDKCFFAYNQGLNSRFPWRFHTDDYKADELNKIFAKKVKEIGWSLEKEIKNDWFEDKMDYFKFYGRDIETLLAKTKIAHGRRVFCKDEHEKRVITQKDVNKGFEMFTDNKEVKNRVDKQSFIPFMYT